MVVDAAQRAPWRVLFVAGLITIGACWATATRLVINTDPNVMLSPQLPFRAAALELAETFPVLQDNLVLVIDATEPDAARDATLALAAKLAEDQSRIRHVFVPQISSFFEDHALFYADIPALTAIEQRIQTATPLLSALAADPSLARLLTTATLAKGQPSQEEGPDHSIDLVMSQLALATNAWLDGNATPPAWRDWILSAAPEDESRTRYIILVQPVLDFASLQPAREAMTAVRNAVKALGFGQDIDVRITGDLALITEELVLAKREVFGAAAGSFALVTTLLLATLLSARLVLAIATTLLLGLIWTAGFAALAVGHLNLLSMAFAVLFIGLGVDFGIHFGVRYRELRDRGVPLRAALSESGRSVGSSLVLCALTTAIGFYAFLPTPYAGVAELGLISGTGMFFSLAATLGVLPAILVLAGGTAPRKRDRRRRNVMLLNLPSFPVVYPRTVCAVATAAGIIAAMYLPKVWFDSDPLNVRDPAAESVQTMRALLSDVELAPWNAEILVRADADLDALTERIEALPEVEYTVAIDDFLPLDQREKLAAFTRIRAILDEERPTPPLDDMLAAANAQLLDAAGMPLRGAIANFPAVRHQHESTRDDDGLSSLRRALVVIDGLAAQGTLPTGLSSFYGSVQRALARLEASDDPAAGLKTLERQLLGDIQSLIADLKTALPSAPIAEMNLPLDLRERFLAPSGERRLEVYPSIDLNQRENLALFADAVRSAAPQATGPAILIVETGRAMVASLFQALGVALVAIAIFLTLLWRSARDMALALAPLLLATTWIAATSVEIGVPINFADIVVVPLLFGMGIDSGIHLVHRHRMAGLGGPDVLHTSTARAVVFSSLTTMASFASLAFSQHRGTASLGTLLTIGMAYMLLANLVVLPALLSWLTPTQRKV